LGSNALQTLSTFPIWLANTGAASTSPFSSTNNWWFWVETTDSSQIYFTISETCKWL
jgi:hypothetical protein